MKKVTTIVGAVAGLAALPSDLAAESNVTPSPAVPMAQPESRVQPSEKVAQLVEQRYRTLKLRQGGGRLIQGADDKWKDAAKFTMKNAFSNFDKNVLRYQDRIINPAYRKQLQIQQQMKIQQQRKLQLQRINQIDPAPGHAPSTGPVAESAPSDVQAVFDQFKPG